MKNFIINIALFLIIIHFESFAQKLIFIDIDTTNYPMIKAKFFAFDKNGNVIKNIKKNDLMIKENGNIIDNFDIYCPISNVMNPISSVLTVDISASMSGDRVRYFKQGILYFINNLPLGISEAAITSFDDYNYLNQDFTTNKDKLLKALNSLQTKAGTDYNIALIKPNSGALLISKNAQNRKVIILLTDGKSNTETLVNEIINEANQQNCQIYSIVSSIKCPESLKLISENTGAYWFEDINTEDEAKAIYNSILMISQGIEPCEIEWESKNCNNEMILAEISLLELNLKASKTYFPAQNKVPKLEINPQIIKFTNPKINEVNQQLITIKAINQSFEISDVILSNLNFEINPKKFNLSAGESKQLILSFTPKDSNEAICNLNFINNLCPKSVSVYSRFPLFNSSNKNINLIVPNGNEVFVAGSQTIIKWAGVAPDELVEIDYSINNGQSWEKIASQVNGLEYNWTVPARESDSCLARVTTVDNSATLDIPLALIPKGNFIMGNTGKYGGFPEEFPNHSVSISYDFLMSKYEISQHIYQTIMGNNPSQFKGDSLPVEMISWDDAIEFCNKLSDFFNLDRCYNIIIDPKSQLKSITCNWDANGYRLPTEAEWEYAYKAGTTSDFYNGDINETDCIPIDTILNEIGWYCSNSKLQTQKIGQKLPNKFGLFDMSGNVWEWCWDYFGIYNKDSSIDPKGASTGTSRILRGGSWVSNANFCRASLRYSFPEGRSNGFGIRVLRVVK